MGSPARDVHRERGDRYEPGGGGLSTGAGTGDLRWAITQANANGIASDTINFAIGAVGSAQTITLQDGADLDLLGDLLPAINTTIIINGWSQGGGAYTGPPLIVINGNDTPGDGLALTANADNSTIRGLRHPELR